MTALTDRRRAVVLAVADLTAELGYPPTYREIAAAVGVGSTDTVARAVWHLRQAGIVRPEAVLNRCLCLAPDVVVSREGKVARVVWAEGLGPAPRRVTQNSPGNCPAGAAYHQPANDHCEESPAMPIIPDAEHRARIIDGLRQLATYLDEHPDVPVGFTPISLEFAASASRNDDEARTEVDRVAAMLDATTETSSHGTYSASKCFGAATYRAYAAPKAETRRVNAGLSYLDSVTPEVVS